MFFMNMLHAIITFILVLFLYSQIMFQLKKGDDIEIYETDFTTNAELNTSANLKQPFIFQFSEYDNNLKTISLAEYGSFDVIVKDVNDYYEDKPYQSIVLTLNASTALMKTDADAKYFSDSNQYFIDETGIEKYYSQFDKYLNPHFSVFSKYDVLFGSPGSATPLTYHTYERKYMYVTSGKIKVKMTPWRSNKYMIINKNYKEYEFTSPLNVWKPQDAYLNGYQKMKFLEFTVYSGSILYIPPFWHYSIQFSKDDENRVHVFNYGSVMNVLSNAFNLSHHYYEKFVQKPKEPKGVEEEAVPITI